MTSQLQAISQYIWDMKYRYRLGESLIDHSLIDTWQRVACAVAAVEKQPVQAKWQQAFYHILEDFQFLPGGRILAGAGTQHEVTLLNCFVMDIAEDALPAIFTALSEGALTLQQGGGVGYDFSVLRPRGELVAKTGANAAGPVAFMRIWDSMCSAMLSTGARRGAMMGVLRCDHPDIEQFIAAKSDPHELRHFNVSVMVSDAFMTAVQQDQSWPLVFPANSNQVYRRVSARILWEKMIRAAYDHAEPGVLFGDTINRMNNLHYREQINATNPCGEIPLPAYGACNLGSINLTQFVEAAFTSQAKIKWQQMEEVIRIATRFLDNVIDASHYPLESQRQQALGSRRIGLGVTGLADSFVMLGIEYASQEARALAGEIMQRIMQVTWQTSIELAREKGVFPFYAREYLQGEFVQTLNPSLHEALKKYGIRNSHHNTIAPTGTISLLANNVSNGIEPIYHAAYKRYVRSLQNESLVFQVNDYAYQLWQERGEQNALPPAWQDTQSLMPEAHLKMQAAMQVYIDNAISKTINIPADFPFEKCADVYTQAYTLGLKGCTIFRPNPVTGTVLEAEENVKCCLHD